MYVDFKIAPYLVNTRVPSLLLILLILLCTYKYLIIRNLVNGYSYVGMLTMITVTLECAYEW